MNKELIATILREVCETDPADATLPTTVCINVDVLGRIVDQALAQQEQCGCREGECETKKDKTCRMTIEIAERDGIPEWTQEQPASVDAYVGAREDAAIWKKRALEAEELNRKFIAEVNGPTYLGEPTQPAQEHENYECPTCQHEQSSGEIECNNCGRTYLVEAPPTQPAMSDDEILNCFYASKSEGMVSYMIAVGRAIESHCRGGTTS